MTKIKYNAITVMYAYCTT